MSVTLSIGSQIVDLSTSNPTIDLKTYVPGPIGPVGPPGPTSGSGFILPTNSAIGGDRAVGTIDGYVVYADAASGIPAIGLSTSAVDGGEDVTVVSGGKQIVTAAGWTSGQPIYLGANGTLTQTAPTSGILQHIGVAHNSETIIIKVSQPLTLS